MKVSVVPSETNISSLEVGDVFRYNKFPHSYYMKVSPTTALRLVDDPLTSPTGLDRGQEMTHVLPVEPITKVDHELRIFK